MSEHAVEHHEHEVILTAWPLVIGIGALFIPLGFMSYFSWHMSPMVSIILAGIGVVAILIGGFGWASEVYAAKHDFGLAKPAIIFFIVSEALLFGGLFSGYFYNLVPIDMKPPANTPEGVPPITMAIIMSVFLLSSSGTIHIAEERLVKNNISGFIGWLLATMILGAIFIGMQAKEWTELFHEGFTVSTNVYGTFFFVITGFHGSHVIVGLIMQLFVLLLAFGNKIRHGKDTIMKTTGYYWHFVDGIWLVVFSLIYAIPYLMLE
ncbi:MAG: heme-copper oxidase subunit III [Nitrospirae bacterium]|nr:MAG: heme-copper oxidase subunit III [Nitrospirota bacterium]